MSSFESICLSVSICLSRYGVPKDKDGRDNYYYYYDDDDDVAWAATEVYNDETYVLFYDYEYSDEYKWMVYN